MTRRVLVTDGEERSIVGTVRCLSEHRYETAVVAHHRPAAAQWSNACDHRHVLPDPRESADGFVDGLAALVAATPHLTVLPGSDAALLAISEHRERLEPHVDLGLPPHAAVAACVDKAALAEASEHAGMASPRGGLCEDAEASVTLARRLGYPVVVKPRRSVFVDGGVVHTRGGRFAADEAALRELLRHSGSACVIQKAEPGYLQSCSGVLAGGRLLAMALSRYDRTWPPDSGNAAYATTVTPDGELFARVERLLVALGWEGIFELELIRHPDGRDLAIDLNPRPFGSISLVIRAGAPLPAVWCDWLASGRPATPGRAPLRARPGVRYRWEDAELRHALWQTRRGHLRAAAAVAVPHPGVVHAHFRHDDPKPLAARVLTLVLARLRRRRLQPTPRTALHT
jgi:predicted ATP-grasp superfamily ATP-dependent carboligase